jgi:phosphoribosylglycinamide formyltransferase 1
MKQIAIFASGAGTNAARIIDHFRDHPLIKVALIVCNRAGAGVLTVAEKAGIPSLLIEKTAFLQGSAYVDELRSKNIGFIVLAGFLWKIPGRLIQAFPGRIINIHPALLPKYGGKGMYGSFVHEAVIKAGDKETGITIHYVDEEYDHGKPIFQAKVVVEADDTPETLAKKVHLLEYEHFPRIIEEVIDLQNHR